MEYLTAKQFSNIWGITERRIIKLCNEGRINGAEKNGMVWNIPKDTLKPSDKRSNIYKYINIEKRIMIVNCKKEIQNYLLELLIKQGFVPEFKKINKIKNNSIKYYEGLIYFEDSKTDEEKFIKEFSKKLNFESSIVIVRNENKQQIKEALKLRKQIGLRINTLVLDIEKDDMDINYYEISEDIINLLVNFKNTTGATIVTDGGKLQFDKKFRKRRVL